MKNSSVFVSLHNVIARDKMFVFTLLSYVTIVAIFVNISFINSPIIGIVASSIYLLINAAFLGHSVFETETLFMKFLLGTLLSIVILGLIAWAVMILSNLDNVRSAIVLLIAASFSSFLNRKVKHKNANQ